MAPGFWFFLNSERAGFAREGSLHYSKLFTFYSVLCFSPRLLVAIGIPRFARDFGRVIPSPLCDEPMLFAEFISCKKITQLEACGFIRVRAMDGVVLNARRPLLADGARLGVCRIGSAHQLAQVGDGIVLFQR